MRNAASRILLVTLVALVAGSLAPAVPAAAADRTVTLFGDQASGWGLTNTTLSNPGPTITVDEGDNVTLTLNGTDGSNHRWFIDYDNDSTDDANEPDSPNFRDTAVTWNFTADRNGTFTYRCRFHPDTMYGTIVVRAASNPPSNPPPATDYSLAIVAGIVVAFVAVLAFLGVIARRRGTGPRTSPGAPAQKPPESPGLPPR